MDISLIENLIALLSAGLGALLAVSLGVSHKKLCALISFAAGTLFATTSFHIVPEAWSSVPFWALVLALGSGYFLFYWISKRVAHVCPACSASHFEHQNQERLKNILMLLTIGLSIHNIMDGMAIAVGHDAAHEASHSIFLTVTIHKFPEGLALCAILLKTGYEKTKAFFMSLVFESTSLVGWILGVYLLRGFSMGGWIDLALLHAGGGFIYLALHAVLNEAKEHSPKLIIVSFAAGMLLIGLTHRL
jgi:zinc transporter, ZIP family